MRIQRRLMYVLRNVGKDRKWGCSKSETNGIPFVSSKDRLWPASQTPAINMCLCYLLSW